MASRRCSLFFLDSGAHNCRLSVIVLWFPSHFLDIGALIRAGAAFVIPRLGTNFGMGDMGRYWLLIEVAPEGLKVVLGPWIAGVHGSGKEAFLCNLCWGWVIKLAL